MPLTIHLVALGFCVGIPGAFLSHAADVESGPLAHQFRLTLSPGRRTEVLGPLLSYERREAQTQWVLPPLFSHTLDTSVDVEELDLAYPLLTYDRFGTEYRFQFFQMFSFSGGLDQQEGSVRRFTLFPFYFQQRAADSNLNYTALFPLYGRLKNRLFRDEIRFVLFPLYGHSRKRDVVKNNSLSPFFPLRPGVALGGWQFC